MTYGKVIFGDNQFLGVNHANQAKAIELYERFKKTDAILSVIGAAYESGIRDFMFTTHDRYDTVFDEIRRSNLFAEMYYTPCLPYAHKYWNQLSDKGLVALIASTLMQVQPLKIVPAFASLLMGKPDGLIELLTRVEILMCKGLKLRGIFLQNLAFDFLVGLGQYNIIENFSDVVGRRLNVIPGFITMNHSTAVDVLCNKIGLNNPWICANFNIAGLRMNPCKEACEKSFSSSHSNNIAMSVFSSGRLPSLEATIYVNDYIKSGAIKSILFGSSNPVNIKNNFDKFSNQI